MLDVIRAVHLITIHQHDGEDVFLALVVAREDLVLGDGDRGGALNAPLNLDMTVVLDAAIVGYRWTRSDIPARIFRQIRL